MIKYTISRIMVLNGLLMVLPIIVALIYREDFKNILSFLATILLILLIFFPGMRKKPEDDIIYVKEGLVITALIWILMSIFGGLPYYFSATTNGFIDSFFEAASGFTTTGATIITDIESVDRSIQFWRSLTHFIGGMGVLVFAVAMLPESDASSVQVVKAEMPGPSFGKLLPKLRSTAQTLYTIYIVMTLVLILILIFAGMPVFDSINHALSVAGTGGFSIKNESIGHYNSNLIELILSIAMIVYSVNFNVYYLILIARAKEAVKSEELRYFLLFILIATGLIVLDINRYYSSLFLCLKDAFFTVTTIISTTGFATVNFDLWPTFSKVIILILMFIGGCAGSTAGGLKVSRVVILIKSSVNTIRSKIQPNRVQVINFENKTVKREKVEDIKSYFIIYMGLLIFFIACFALINHGFEESFSAVITSMNNVGPGFETIGPSLTYHNISSSSKLLLSIIMILGRLEIYPILLLFSRETWKDY